jgi:DNA-binding LacI/PurR family transcriptional regulator
MTVSPSSPQEPTIRSVAARAGVSKSLVSLVLQGSPKVSEHRREAVLRAIDELGYRPNAAARSLSRRTPGAVGVLVNDLRNPWFVRCLEGLTAGLRPSGLGMLLGDRRLDDRESEPMLNRFIDMRLDGLVLMGTMPLSPTIQEAAQRLPTVMVGHRDFHLPSADMSAQDDVNGTRLAMEHLYELGHRRIAHLAGEEGQASLARRQTYEELMEGFGLAAEARVESCDLTEEDGYAAACRLLDGERRPTAIFAVNDLACVGALSAARERNLAVPEQLSLIGFDNTPLAGSRHLWLTTIDYDLLQVGVRAAKLLIQRIADPSRPAADFRSPASLVVRGTTGSVPRAGTTLSSDL